MSKNQKISDLEARLNQLERRFKEHKHSRGIIDELRGYRDPDPPLNARVEKVLGEEIQYFWDYGWLVKDIDRRGPSDLIRGELWRKPYKRDTDGDLAIEALEEYCKIKKVNGFIRISHTYRGFGIDFGVRSTAVWGESFPETICRAIVKCHKGGKDE